MNSIRFLKVLVLVRYGYYVRTKRYEKNPNAKHAVKAEISMKTKSFNDGETFGIIRRPASKWRRIPFYDVSNDLLCQRVLLPAMFHIMRWRRRPFEPLQEKGWFKWDVQGQCVVGIDFIVICECVRSCKFYQKLRLASGFILTKSTRTVTLQDVPLLNVTSGHPYASAEVTILVREYPENYQK